MMRVLWFFVGCSFLFDAYQIASVGYMPSWWLVCTAWVALGLRMIGESLQGKP